MYLSRQTVINSVLDAFPLLTTFTTETILDSTTFLLFSLSRLHVFKQFPRSNISKSARTFSRTRSIKTRQKRSKAVKVRRVPQSLNKGLVLEDATQGVTDVLDLHSTSSILGELHLLRTPRMHADEIKESATLPTQLCTLKPSSQKANSNTGGSTTIQQSAPTPTTTSVRAIPTYQCII